MIPQGSRIESFFGQWEFAVDYVACASDVDGYSMRELLDLADTESLALWEGLELGYTETAPAPARSDRWSVHQDRDRQHHRLRRGSG